MPILYQIIISIIISVFSSSQAIGKINSSIETIAAFSTVMCKYLDKNLTLI